MCVWTSYQASSKECQRVGSEQTVCSCLASDRCHGNRYICACSCCVVSLLTKQLLHCKGDMTSILAPLATQLNQEFSEEHLVNNECGHWVVRRLLAIETERLDKSGQSIGSIVHVGVCLMSLFQCSELCRDGDGICTSVHRGHLGW